MPLSSHTLFASLPCFVIGLLQILQPPSVLPMLASCALLLLFCFHQADCSFEDDGWMHHEVNLVSSVGHIWKGIMFLYTYIRAQIGRFRNRFQVILYVSMLKLPRQDRVLRHQLFSLNPTFFHVLFLTCSFLTASRSNTRQGNNWNTCVFCPRPASFLYFLSLLWASFFVFFLYHRFSFVRFVSAALSEEERGIKVYWSS